MIRLPTSLRSLLRVQYISQRAYASVATRQDVGKHLSDPQYLSNYAQVSPQLKRESPVKAYSPKASKIILKSPGSEQDSDKARVKGSSISQLPKLPQNIQLEQIPGEILSLEKDAKTRIYNYGAAFGLVPQFHDRFWKYQGEGEKLSNVAEVVIKLSEQDIEVSAVADNYLAAEIAASIKF